jgi:dipeptidase E
VRLYLSSFRMGDHPEHLVALTGGDSRRRAVIANAMDDAPPQMRRAGVELELAALAGLGLDAVELDLRSYFGQEQRLRRDLAGVSMAWLRGGQRGHAPLCAVPQRRRRYVPGAAGCGLAGLCRI